MTGPTVEDHPFENARFAILLAGRHGIDPTPDMATTCAATQYGYIQNLANIGNSRNTFVQFPDNWSGSPE